LTDGPAVLELRGVRKSYAGQAAVAGLDLLLRRHEFLTFLGPSGSGKTTTLMLVAGLQQPDAGSILLDGAPVDRTPSYRRDIGMVFQHYALFPHMTVRRNVAFPLEMRRVDRAETGRRVQEALGLVGLAGLDDRLPRQLSGGQQQRVALARAMVYRPALLLMDEPLGALDKQLRGQLQLEIKRMHRELRMSVLYVTHDQDEALTMSDRIAVFNAGRIEQVGTPLDLYERPATRFVAGFIGETNFFPGTVVGAEAGGRPCRVDVSGALLGATLPGASVPGASVTVAVRPERIRLHAASEGAAGLPGTVLDSIYLGHSWRFVIGLADGRDCQVLRPADAVLIAPGQPVTLSWDAAHATAFPG
jgi:putative spermidine/putrescine transport system ATP-binding protein